MYIYLIFESGRHHPIRTLKLNFKIHSYAKMPSTNETKLVHKGDGFGPFFWHELDLQFLTYYIHNTYIIAVNIF